MDCRIFAKNGDNYFFDDVWFSPMMFGILRQSVGDENDTPRYFILVEGRVTKYQFGVGIATIEFTYKID